MKYIDSEKLKAEIERLHKAHSGKYGCDEVGLNLEYLEDFIDSLQQEQPDFPTTDEQIKEFLATHPKIEVPEKYKNPDWLFKKQEQPEADLEKEFNHYCFDFIDPDTGEYIPKEEISFTFDDALNVARHFAKWGAEHLKK